MLENLINLVRQHAGDAIINNPAIPDNQNEAAVTETGNSIINSLKNMISQGQGNEVLNLFHNGTGNIASNPAVQNISNGLIQSLVNKFGLGQQAATGVASNLIPVVLQNLVHKTNDPGDNSFDLQGIIAHLTGGQGIQGVLSNLEQGGGADIMNTIKGLFDNK